MNNKLTVAPVATAVALADARTAARANSTELDGELDILIRSITEEVEHYTGRALITQTWTVTLDAFDGDIVLPRAPVASVTSLKYYNAANEFVTLDPQDYTVDTSSEFSPGFIVRAAGRTWPDTYGRVNAVQATVVCGYGASDASVPYGIKGYILAKIREAYMPEGFKPNPDLIRGLDRYMVRGF